MPTVTRENIGLLNEKIVVKVEKEDYLPSFEKAIKNYSKQANIPGFRKGMVPVGMVKKMYGSSVFADEVIKSVEKGLTDYMTGEKLEIFAQPLPLPENDSRNLDMNQPSEYSFSFEVGLKPEFNIEFHNDHLTRYQVEVTDEMVNEELERLLTNSGDMVEQETVSSEDNMIGGIFVESDAEGNEVEVGLRKETSLQVKYFNQTIREQLWGKKVNDFLVLQIATAFEDKERDWMYSDLGLSKEDPQSADKFFKFIISKISIIEKAVLNEEMFKKVFPDKEVSTEEEFRNELRRQIQSQWDAQSRNQLLDQLYHELLSHTKIDFPEDFLKRWMLTGGEKSKTQEEVDKEYPTFVNQLKWTLILDKIVHENDIKVEPEDLRNFAKQQLLSYMGGSNIDIDQPWVNTYIDKMVKDKKFVEDSFHRIQTEKAFEWAEQQIQPVEATISESDFQKLVKEHKHEH